MSRRPILQIALLLAALTPGPSAQTQKRLWVLQPPDKFVEYDIATFAPGQSLTVPAEVLRNPETLAVNNKGQILFTPRRDEAALDPKPNTTLWFWDGHRGVLLDRGIVEKARPAGRSSTVVEAVPQPFLSEDGAHLYWFANFFTKQKSTEGLERSVETSFRIWRTDLSGKRAEQIATFSFLPCKCDTGTCEETCPQGEFWAPEAGVGDFFLVTHWVPGQLGSEYQSSFLYRKLNGNWPPRKLPHPVSVILDAASGGATMVEANPDGACCGRVNEGDDQTLITRNGRTTMLFDELERYHNPDYDVSFRTRVAKLAPRLDSVAMEIVSSAEVGGEVRLLSDGTASAGELAEIKRAMAQMPVVEVLTLDPSPKRAAMLPHTALVGWLTENEILIVEDQQLVAFNPLTRSRRKSGIKTAPSRVFLR
ncbi:MAG TPA: hypothetical protein VGK99_20430 [Acidobacteriota bacterium]